MKCSLCSEKSVLYREYEGRALCKKHFLKSFEKKVKDTIRRHKLIERGDKILVGLSGGKDSAAMLYFLNKFFGKREDLTIEAILIDEGIHDYREHTKKDAQKLCDELGIKLHIYSYSEENKITMDRIMKEKLNEDLSSCAFCGVFRRDLLNRYSRELGATKLAIGHNLDDEVQAILMNYLKGDLLRMARMGFKSVWRASEDFVPRIKIFRMAPEREVGLYAVLSELSVEFNECPYAKDSFRFEVRDFINEMEDKHPTTKFSILNTFDKMLPVILEMVKDDKKIAREIRKCSRCGEPCSGEICKKCSLLLRLKNSGARK